MNLTPEQQAILNGEKGEVLAKVMKTLVMYGDAFGAEKLVPVTSKYGHTVISFGINTMKPVYDLYDQLLASGVKFQQKFHRRPASARSERPFKSFAGSRVQAVHV